VAAVASAASASSNLRLDIALGQKNEMRRKAKKFSGILRNSQKFPNISLLFVFL